ncbi:XRE family transcriptional regulator [Streptomyces pluripotens]|uniref:XRE family transcriptional regulator n=1 Tax=Streptomyces pluripotens TaxID=1355015 RepID=A0A221P391_9ACTN|nr:MULTISPECIES: helix-turn-helix transcriptional regulator [Streptomyces]ARP72490.1 transcriptional regulator [Streptomyces pluripotens]ASN26743.1 XRE family transcriptional regulator [Streptomyces pluripotens]KIE26092.1 DNA-binding protein [Streptomyces sp. MUSC 125]MCH0559532.1 helix-turn-helix domain-containing protein [Streptomyces sp. MUM 16J]
MAAKRGRTAQRLELGLQLRQLRENCGLGDRGGGLTRRQAVVGLRISEASLQRIESGSLNFRNVGDLRKLLEKYGVTDEGVIESMINLNRESANQDWLTQYRGLMPAGMPGFVGLEPEALSMKAYHPTLVYGLLQTERYARVVHEVQKPIEEYTSEFIRSSVELRMKRQEVLTRGNPVKLHVILGEAALRYPIGGADVMREQFARIQELSGRDHVTIQVLPFRPSYRSVNDFAILDFGSELPPRVQTDSAWGSVSTSDKPREVDRFTRRFNAMTASALPPEDTPEFLSRLEREL